MKLLGKYCYRNRKEIFLFFAFACICGIVFLLYGYPAQAVLYGALLCAFTGLVVGIRDYVKFAYKYRLLVSRAEQAGMNWEKLPEAEDALEEVYQDIICKLYGRIQELEDTRDGRQQELMDYYTVWTHQIKTPIASMKLLLHEEDSDRGRELGEELFRIEQYVEMAMMALRLDSDSTDYVIREYPLDDIVRQAVRKFAPQFIRRKIRLCYEPLNVLVLTDEKWLAFVVEQVLSNALKYTGEGGTVTVYMEEEGLLCIQDTGIGIAPEDIPKKKKKGYTGYNGRTDKKASGIGLYLCRRICGSLGHRIWALSSVGEGTVIKLDLRKTNLEIE